MLHTPKLFNLTGKTALITGAGGLLGPKHAEALVDCGAFVIMTDHHEDRAVEKAAMLNNKYGKKVAAANYMDVTNKKWVEPMTLKAFIKEQVQKGQPIPFDIFNIYVGRKTKMKRT